MSIIGNLVPIGTGIISNSSSTITPVNGSLAVDSTTTGFLNIGNGSTFNGIPTVIDTTITPTFTSGTSTISPTIYMQVVTSQTISLCNFVVAFPSGGIITVIGTYIATGLPAGFRPSNIQNFPLFNYNSAGNILVGHINFSAGTNMQIVTTASGSILFSNASGLYFI